MAMAAVSYTTSIYVTNNLMSDLVYPSPHLIYGTLGTAEWPTILRGKTSDEIRINALNPQDGVEGSVTYSSVVLGHRRKVTLFFSCNDKRNAASATSSLSDVAVTVVKMTKKPPLVVTYKVQELIDF